MLKSKLENIEEILNGKIKLQHRIPDYNYGHGLGNDVVYTSLLPTSQLYR